MNRRARIQNPAIRLRVSNWLRIRRRQLRERNIEAHLKDVENSVANLGAGAYLTWLTDPTRMCEVTEELRAKVEAVHWMLRVAQHFSGPKPEAILAAAEESLDDLDKAVGSEMHSSSIPSEPACSGLLCTS